MLKETPRSLRLYFVLVAAFSFLSAAEPFVKGTVSTPIAWLSVGVGLAFGILYALIAIRFDALLRKPTPIQVVLIVNLVQATISFAASLLQGTALLRAILGFALSALIFVYLIRSVRRLSLEATSTPPDHSPDPPPNAAP